MLEVMAVVIGSEVNEVAVGLVIGMILFASF